MKSNNKIDDYTLSVVAGTCTDKCVSELKNKLSSNSINISYTHETELRNKLRRFLVGEILKICS